MFETKLKLDYRWLLLCAVLVLVLKQHKQSEVLFRVIRVFGK